MRKKSVAVLAAAMLAGSSSIALAQSGSGGSQGGQGGSGQSFGSNEPGVRRDWIPGPLSPTAERSGNPVQYNRAWPAGDLSAAGELPHSQGQIDGQSRFNQRVALRQQLRQSGFQNIRILDTAFLVRALTPQGQPVVMILSPSDEGGGATTSSLGANRSAGGQGPSGQRPQQSDMTGSAAPGLEALLDLRELNSPMVNPGLVEPGQVRSYLQSRGFSGISNLRRDGSFYTGTAEWRGQQVDLRVDARNGLIVEPEQYIQSQLRQPGLQPSVR